MISTCRCAAHMWVNGCKRLLSEGASPCRKVCRSKREKKGSPLSVGCLLIPLRVCVCLWSHFTHFYLSTHTRTPTSSVCLSLSSLQIRPACRSFLCLLDKQCGVCRHAGHIMPLLCSSMAKKKMFLCVHKCGIRVTGVVDFFSDHLFVLLSALSN